MDIHTGSPEQVHILPGHCPRQMMDAQNLHPGLLKIPFNQTCPYFNGTSASTPLQLG